MHRRRLDQTAFGFAFVKTCVAHVPDIVIEYMRIPHTSQLYIPDPRYLTIDDFTTAARTQQNVHTHTHLHVFSAAASGLLHFSWNTFGDERLSGWWCGPNDKMQAQNYGKPGRTAHRRRECSSVR